MRLKEKKNVTKKPRPLAKGQVWKTKDFHVQIVELGNILVHYKLAKDLGQMRRTQMSRIDNMQEYLKTNKARLLTADY
jgi:hypothetical protein